MGDCRFTHHRQSGFFPVFAGDLFVQDYITFQVYCPCCVQVVYKKKHICTTYEGDINAEAYDVLSESFVHLGEHQ